MRTNGWKTKNCVLWHLNKLFFNSAKIKGPVGQEELDLLSTCRVTGWFQCAKQFHWWLIINNRRKEFPSVGKIVRGVEEAKLRDDSQGNEPERLSNKNAKNSLPDSVGSGRWAGMHLLNTWLQLCLTETRKGWVTRNISWGRREMMFGPPLSCFILLLNGQSPFTQNRITEESKCCLLTWVFGWTKTAWYNRWSDSYAVQRGEQERKNKSAACFAAGAMQLCTTTYLRKLNV